MAGKRGFTTSASGVAPTTVMTVKSSMAWKGIFLKIAGLITWLFETKPSVCPSGAALAMAEAPMTPPAPGRFSITTGWPKARPSATEAERAMVSTPEPALTGSTTRTGRES